MRTLVRETIQKALVAQSRNEGHAERIMFTHPKLLGDSPGPGTYEAPAAPKKGALFGAIFRPSGSLMLRKPYVL